MPSKTKKVIRIISIGLLLGFFLLIAIAYLQYRDFKKVIVARLTSQTTSFIGQEVSVGDLSFSPAGGITIHNIIVHNPEGFAPGNLLTIKKLSLEVRYKELFKRHLSFDRISVKEPELTLVSNREGKLNFSDKLKEFFARKPTLEYRIDEFIISSGVVDYNGDRKFRNDDINLSLRNLSSQPDTKTAVSGHTTYAGSMIAIDGSVYLKNEPKRLNITISSNDISPALSGLLNQSGVELAKTKASVFLNAEGDTEKGVHFTSEIGIKDAKLAFLRKDAEKIILKIQAFLDVPDQKLVIGNASLNAGGVTAITVQGEIRKEEDFIYTAGVTVNMLDLSSMNIFKNVTMTGIIASDNLRVMGSFKKPFPELSGSLQLRDATLLTRDLTVGETGADIRFFPGGEAGLSFDMKDVRYGRHIIRRLQAKTGISYRGSTVRLKFPDVKSEVLAVSSDHAVFRLPMHGQQHGVHAEIRGMHASYPEQQAGIRNADLSLNISRVKNVFTWSCNLAADEVMFRQVRTGSMRGRISFDGVHFSVDIPGAHISDGNIMLAAEGRTAEDIFPITVKAGADNINLEYLSGDIAKISKRSYPVSGNVTRAVFEGTIDSAESVRGKASLKAEKITIPGRDKNRTMLKDGTLTAGIEFRGKDLDIRADAGAGKISANVVGTVKDFGQKFRSGEFKITVPEVKAADIRESLWDVFPDSLLYVGMDGSLAADIVVQYDEASAGVSGTLALNDIVLTGENGEYTIGPVNGVAPLLYSRAQNPGVSSSHVDKMSEYDGTRDSLKIPSFEKNAFESLSTYYTQRPVENGYSLITVGSVSYGFPLLDAIQVWVRPEGNSLHIARFSGNIFGGKLNGSAIINLADSIKYSGGFLIKDLSLTQLCDRIEPIRGYITGAVNGIAALKGEGAGVSQLIGKADFWTDSTQREKTEISREFLQKIGGPSLKMYLGDRSFDKGIMSLYLQGGYMIFRELEISNRNFIGMKDLDIKVAPLNNRISLDHLMWSITEAAYRAEKK
jgi:hypothetical protein